MANIYLCIEDGKDLGIPNNFPYKDQILAEVAEQRRQVGLTLMRVSFNADFLGIG